MSRERELLQRALDVLIEIRKVEPCNELIADIRAELEKPEPVDCGEMNIQHGNMTISSPATLLMEAGRYKLLAVRIDAIRAGVDGLNVEVKDDET